MKVLEILRLASRQMQLDNVLSMLNEEEVASAETTRDINTLTRALNMVVQDIAYTYISLVNTEKLSVTDGKLYYISLEKPIIDIISITTTHGNKLKGKAYPDSIELPIKEGNVTISYSYAPEVLTELTQEVPSFNNKLNADTLSFGTCAEYLFMLGVYDDARMWESRFKNNLFVSQSTKREVRMPERGWW